MKIFKFLPIAACIVLSSLLFTSCGDSKEQLVVYNWGDYIDMDTVAAFEEEYNVKVVYEQFDSNEAMYVKVKESNDAYDVLVPSDYMIQRLIKEDMLSKINFDNVPNIENVNPIFRKTPHDPAGEYAAGYMWGTVGILYNTEMVTEPVDSWNILWDEAYKGQIIMYDSMRDSFAVALKALNYSLNTRDENELNDAKNLLISQKPLLQARLTDAIKDKMIQGEAALAVVYSGDAFYCQGENPALEYSVPDEGSNIWYDGMVITKNSKHKELAEKFINFMCRPDIALKNAEYIGFTPANNAALEMLDEETLDNHIFLPTEDELLRCQMFEDLGDFQKAVDKAWTDYLTIK